MATYREKDGFIVREYALEQKPILYKQTKKAFIEIVPTKEYGKTLFIDNELQFSEKDEYIYHEMLVHPCLSLCDPRNICIIGGGDGLAAREVLKWHTVEAVDVIDWDEGITNYFMNEETTLNANSLQDPRVRIYNENIQESLHDERNYDAILVDLLDPDFTKEGQLDLWYDIIFMTKHWISPTGCIVINAGGITPWDTTTLNRLIELLAQKTSFLIHLYKVFVPSFGREWCFILLKETSTMTMTNAPANLHYFDENTWKQAYVSGWSVEYQRNICLNLESQRVGEDVCVFLPS